MKNKDRKKKKDRKGSPPEGLLADCTSSIFLSKEFIQKSVDQSQRRTLGRLGEVKGLFLRNKRAANNNISHSLRRKAKQARCTCNISRSLSH